MVMKRKQYTKEFKRQILELREQGKSVREISSEYGIRESLIYRWKKEYGKIGLIEKEETVAVAEYRSLQKKLAQVEMENEILKKQQPYSHGSKIKTHRTTNRKISYTNTESDIGDSA